MRSKKRIKHTRGFNIVLGTVVSIILNIAAGILITSMLQNNVWPDTALHSAALGALCVSVLLSVVIIAIVSGIPSIQEVLIIALCYYIAEIAMGILFFDSTFKNAGWGAVAIGTGSVCAWLIAMQFRPKRVIRSSRSR